MGVLCVAYKLDYSHFCNFSNFVSIPLPHVMYNLQLTVLNIKY